ncbi:MAG: hypothetical protein IPH04_18570 [Saprospirales bacterium]|jgi:hypothetical protein|nr:hypothetical protein [Saprospirales bacterium]MBK6904748.1 hypothetical protein [Saprospirales bacterium]MBK7337095.1 hypothetical protein [Saprospirales bacterium]
MKSTDLLMFAGAILFLAAQLILPGGTGSPAERVEIMRSNPEMWNLGHLLIAASLPLLAVFTLRWYELARLLKPMLSLAGLVLFLWGLFGWYSIALLQLSSQNFLAPDFNENAAVIVGKLGEGSVLTMAFLPYLFLLPGSILLAAPMVRLKDSRLNAWLLILFGAVSVAAGLSQIKVLFVLSGLILVAAAFQFLRGKKMG